MQIKFYVMGFFMFHRPEPRRFNYIPRYYNPEKEALERRKAELGLDSNLSEEDKLRLKMRKSWGRTESFDEEGDRRRARYKTIRFVIIFGIAAVLVYFILFTPVVEDFIKMFLMLGKK